MSTNKIRNRPTEVTLTFKTRDTSLEFRQQLAKLVNSFIDITEEQTLFEVTSTSHDYSQSGK